MATVDAIGGERMVESGCDPVVVRMGPAEGWIFIEEPKN
jgi:hypothetical protein